MINVAYFNKHERDILGICHCEIMSSQKGCCLYPGDTLSLSYERGEYAQGKISTT